MGGGGGSCKGRCTLGGCVSGGGCKGGDPFGLIWTNARDLDPDHLAHNKKFLAAPSPLIQAHPLLLYLVVTVAHVAHCTWCSATWFGFSLGRKLANPILLATKAKKVP